jgi:hypothetical protein
MLIAVVALAFYHSHVGIAGSNSIVGIDCVVLCKQLAMGRSPILEFLSNSNIYDRKLSNKETEGMKKKIVYLRMLCVIFLYRLPVCNI